MSGKILLVEDDKAIATVVTSALRDDGYHVDSCISISERDGLLAKSSYDVMLTDIMLSDGDGLSALKGAREADPDMPVIVMSAQNTLDTAIRASDSEAFEYFPKPFDLDELLEAVKQASASRSSRALAAEGEGGDMPLIGRSAAMQGVYRMITRVLRNDLSVLVTGESGTGKELVAEAIHKLGSRASGPLVAINCAAIPTELIESELFGHEKGAFTGAVSQAFGKFEQAHGGTLFLDEIGDMPASAQTRLLRALQSGRIRRVGGRREIDVNVRIIAATNRDLAPMIEAGTFREDLFYRLNVIPIHLPPLRERREDVPALAQHFFQLAAEQGLPLRQLSEDAADLLENRYWRGNVRELRNMVMRLAALTRDDVVSAATIADLVGDDEELTTAEAGDPMEAALASWLARAGNVSGSLYQQANAAFEKPLFEHALRETEGNQLRAANLLGINRNTLRKRLDELEIAPQDYARRR